MMDFSGMKELAIGGIKLSELSVDGVKVWQAIRYTNQLPISTDTDGSVYNGTGYKNDTYFSGANVSGRTGVVTTGFIPIGYGTSSEQRGLQVIYLKDINAIPTNTNVRLNFYTANKTFLGQLSITSASSSANDPGGYTSTYTLGADGKITQIDVTGTTAYYYAFNNAKKETAYFRICSPGIDANSIITVNEPIE